MNTLSKNYSLILQFAFKPSFWAYISDRDIIDMNIVNNDLFRQLKTIDLKSVKDIFLNVGPGSYTGIRQTVAFVLGLMQINNFRFFKITTFDMLRFLSSKYCFDYDFLVLKAWPRIREVEFSQLKGYMQDKEGTIGDHLVSFNSFKRDKRYAVLLDQKRSNLNVPYNVRLYNFTVDDIYDFFGFINAKSRKFEVNTVDDIKPLYINPVNITQKV